MQTLVDSDGLPLVVGEYYTWRSPNEKRKKLKLVSLERIEGSADKLWKKLDKNYPYPGTVVGVERCAGGFRLNLKPTALRRWQTPMPADTWQ